MAHMPQPVDWDAPYLPPGLLTAVRAALPYPASVEVAEVVARETTDPPAWLPRSDKPRRFRVTVVVDVEL